MNPYQKEIRWRVNLVYLGLMGIGLTIVVHTALLIFVKGDAWRSRAENNTVREVEVLAKRGDIYSADSSLLVMSMALFTVRMDLHESVVSKDTFQYYVRALSDSLALMFPEKSAGQHRRALQEARSKDLGLNPQSKTPRGRGVRNYLLARNIRYPELKRLQSFPILCKGKARGGLVVEEQIRRVRLYELLASRTVGYYNENSQAGVGLEAAYHDVLRGRSGKRIERKIANGVWRPVFNDQYEPEDGKDIITTLDMRVQDVAESALMRCLMENDADHGCAILMEVSTGEIRAIANLKRGKDSSYYEAENYAVNESSEPGSTFKLATLLALLEEGIVDTGFIVPTGHMRVADRELKDSHWEGWGDVSLQRAFEVSSNVGIAYAVRESFDKNPKKFTDHLYRMRLHQPLGLEIPGERKPLIKNPKDHKAVWSKVTLAWMSMGYELMITPLQMLTFYNAVANNGRMVKPMFVREIRSGGQTLERFEPTVLEEKICSDRSLGIARHMLEGVVQNGTAKSLSKSPYKVAGKTGTAQTNYAFKGTQKLTYRASFVGYFPADDPKYTCLVVVSNPQKNRKYGGEVAAPVFKEIADKVYATRLNLDLKHPDVEDGLPWIPVSNADDVEFMLAQMGVKVKIQDDYSYLSAYRGTDDIAFRGVQYRPNEVPNVVGMNVRDAVYLLESLGLKVRLNGRGVVREQSLNAGSPLSKDLSIWLRLS